jgi:hypothetical protein
MKVYDRRPRLPMDSRGRLSYRPTVPIFRLRCVRKEMIVGISCGSVYAR